MTNRSNIWPKAVRAAIEALDKYEMAPISDAQVAAMRAYVHAEIRHVIREDLGKPQPYPRHAKQRAKA